jgi:hypothetical protein
MLLLLKMPIPGQTSNVWTCFFSKNRYKYTTSSFCDEKFEQIRFSTTTSNAWMKTFCVSCVSLSYTNSQTSNYSLILSDLLPHCQFKPQIWDSTNDILLLEKSLLCFFVVASQKSLIFAFCSRVFVCVCFPVCVFAKIDFVLSCLKKSVCCVYCILLMQEK